jgi:hypothetical protein
VRGGEELSAAAAGKQRAATAARESALGPGSARRLHDAPVAPAHPPHHHPPILITPEDDGGYFHFPCFAAAEYICVSRPGEEPPLLSPVEDLTLWDPALVAKARGGAAPAPLTPSARKRFFDVPANLAGRVLDTEHVWTFQLHQSLINFATYKCGLPGMPLGIDLAPLLSCQPLQIMAKDGEVRGGGAGRRGLAGVQEVGSEGAGGTQQRGAVALAWGPAASPSPLPVASHPALPSSTPTPLP